MRISDWSSDVCSSDLVPVAQRLRAIERHEIVERGISGEIGEEIPACMCAGGVPKPHHAKELPEHDKRDDEPHEAPAKGGAAPNHGDDLIQGGRLGDRYWKNRGRVRTSGARKSGV